MADYVSALTGPEIDEALADMASHTSEAWAVGTRNGVPVSSGDVTYNNSSKYWANRANTYNTNAQAAAARAEAAVPAGTAGAVFFDTAQSLTDAQKGQAKENIGAGGMVNPNFLVNPYFVGGIIINQRAFSSATTAGWTVDMWYKTTSYGTLAVSANGLQATGDSSNTVNFSQYIPDTVFRRLLNKTMTASVQYQSGTVESITFTLPATWPTTQTNLGGGSLSNCVLDVIWRTTGNIEFRIRSSSSSTVTYRAVKLELGPISTLGEDVRVDRAEEWRKCLYYFRRITRSSSGTSLSRLGIAQSTTLVAIPDITDGLPMNGAPTASINGDVRFWYGDGNTATITAVSALSNAVGDYHLQATTSGLTRGTVGMLQLTTGAYIDLDSQPALS